MEKGNCNGKERCDSKFVYCLRPLGTQDPQQECSDGKRVSSVNANDDAIDFSNDTVLGLSNPLILHGLTREWSVSSKEGIRVRNFLSICKIRTRFSDSECVCTFMDMHRFTLTQCHVTVHQELAMGYHLVF